jgi:acetoin utilization deacetylase AcuC-like enzyme
VKIDNSRAWTLTRLGLKGDDAMTILFRDDQFLLHETGRHPECPDRLRAIHQRLDAEGLPERFARGNTRLATLEELARVHSPEHVAQIEQFAREGGGRIESDTVMSPQSYDVARLAAGSAIEAVDQVLSGNHDQAVCLIRPPGHHAVRSGAMGFCLFNNVAVAARHAAEAHGLKRVLIVDWDVHHGNGTQDAFYADGQAGFFSVHRWPFYPGSGAADETGTGDGLGATRNLPTTFGTSREMYRDHFRHELEDFASKLRPQLVLVSAGFDSHREDPIGSLGLEVEDFADLTKIVLEVASVHAGGRVVSLLEGGYNPTVLATCVETHLAGLMEQG